MNAVRPIVRRFTFQKNAILTDKAHARSPQNICRWRREIVRVWTQTYVRMSSPRLSLKSFQSQRPHVYGRRFADKDLTDQFPGDWSQGYTQHTVAGSDDQVL